MSRVRLTWASRAIVRMKKLLLDFCCSHFYGTSIRKCVVAQGACASCRQLINPNCVKHRDLKSATPQVATSGKFGNDKNENERRQGEQLRNASS